MSVITSLDMSITNATEASRRIIHAAIDYLREAGKDDQADYLAGELADTAEDIAYALMDIARELQAFQSTKGTIMDINGNTVGSWRIK